MRVGIISLFYNNYNYGGLLQAYALCKYLNANCSGVEAEQICYDTNKRGEEIIPVEPFIKRFMRMEKQERITWFKKKVKKNESKGIDVEFIDKICTRKKAMDRFSREFIPQSSVIYDASNIQNANNEYQVFITGSDQVWNPMITFCHPAYYLKFVDENKTKISYAASIAKDFLTSHEKKSIEKLLSDFEYVSLREPNVYGIKKENGDIYSVVDPTLLLTDAEWDTICSPRIIPEEYLFCYVLGNDMYIREQCKNYAKDNGLTLVTIPFLLENKRSCDINFGDVQLYDIDPTQFLSLIKYSKCVITDSLHASIFSHIFHKEFFVFERKGTGKMGSRIKSFLDIIGEEYRYCEKKNIIEQTIEKKDDRLNSEILYSKNYINKAILGLENEI